MMHGPSTHAPGTRAGSSSLRLLIAGLALCLAIPQAGEAEVRSGLQFSAGPIQADTDRSRRIGGSDAIAGLGDWYLSNGVLCAAVLDSRQEGQLISTGGTLIDLGHCGRDDDQFVGLEPLFNLSRHEILAVSELQAEVGRDSARIVATGSGEGLVYTTTFTLDSEDTERLRIHSVVERVEEGPRFFAFAELLINTESALRNFKRNRTRPFEGFHHISLDDSPYLETAAAISAVEAYLLLGSDEQGPPIAYGYRPIRIAWTDADGVAHPLSNFGLAMESVSLIAILAEPLWAESDELGPLQALQGLFMDLEVGTRLEFEREIRVSKRADLATFTDRLEPSATRVHGRVDDAQARLHFDRLLGDLPEDRSPETMARSDSAGRFELRLPAGRYAMRVTAPGGREHEREIRVPPSSETARNGLDLGNLTLPQTATLELPRGDAMRLVFRGIHGTPDPVFGDDFIDVTIDGTPRLANSTRNDIHLAGVKSDPRKVALPPGRYRVHATRGPEFSVSTLEIEVRAGESSFLSLAPPQREVETPGWISADFHVHAAPSFDSTVNPSTRLASFAAEGGEILVASDHDVIFDYRDQIEKMGLRDVLHGTSGVEITSISHTAPVVHTSGHFNIFPMPYRPDENRGGMIRNEGKRLREILDEARALPGQRVVQLNHPRNPKPLHDGAFFNHLGVAGAAFDNRLPLESPPNDVLLEPAARSGTRDIDFDAIELMNGSQIERYALVVEDWHALLRQGFHKTGTANSDTHSLHHVVATPRNYVRLRDDRVAAFKSDEFIAAIQRGALIGTTGPILEVSMGEAEPGDTYSGRSGTLEVEIRAASWIPVSKLEIYVDGTLVREATVDGPASRSFDLEFPKDAYVTVRASGEAKGVYSEVLPNFTPMAFSNPIYVDADADGKWAPPGLPQRTDG